MVSSVTNFSRNGLSDWLLQRVSAVLMLAYVIFLVVFLLCHPHMTYATWHGLFALPIMKIVTLVVIGSMLIHAWIGLWIVFTDYIDCHCLRLPLQVLVSLLLIGYFVWLAMSVWS